MLCRCLDRGPGYYGAGYIIYMSSLLKDIYSKAFFDNFSEILGDVVPVVQQGKIHWTYF